jgi:hypothetical protein
MKQTDKTPLWLDLRKEYIDDNFDKLRSYLSECSTSAAKDSFFETTIELLRGRVEDLMASIASRPTNKGSSPWSNQCVKSRIECSLT